MAILLVSSGLAHVTARSTVELAGSSWLRVASARMAHYLIFMSVISRRLLRASSNGSGGKDLRTRAKVQVWDNDIYSNSLHWDKKVITQVLIHRVENGLLLGGIAKNHDHF